MVELRFKGKHIQYLNSLKRKLEDIEKDLLDEKIKT